MRHSHRRIGFGALLVAFVSVAGLLLRAEPPQAVGTWASIGATPDSRVGAAAVPLADGRTLIAGGSIDGAPTDSVVIFNPADGSFAAAGTLLAPRVGHTATLLDDGRVLMAGGTVNDLLSADLELFDPSSGTSLLGATMAQPRTGHAATRLADGTVLITGGTSTDGVLQTAEIYDPATGSTAATTFPMLSPRTGASATTLIDGRVLIAGGNNGTTDLASAELYQPSSQIFEATDTSLSVPRSGHAAVLLPHNNAVLIAGGSSNGVAQQSSELFLPAEFPDPYSYGMGHFGPTGDMLSASARAIAAPHIEGYAFTMGGGAADAEVYRFPTLKTDKDDYPPGQQAVITGSGWEPNSEVTLLFQEDPAVHEDYVLHVPTDSEGNVYWDQWAPEEHDLNVRFYLMAKQATPQGERRAQTTFTDAKNLTVTFAGNGSGSVAITDTTDAGNNMTCTATCSDSTGNTDVGTLKATASPGSVFVGWSAQSSGITGCVSDTCNFSMGNSAQSVTATFSATATVTPATGGGAISADTAGGAFTSLTGPVIAETATGIIGAGTIVLNAPAGFTFDTGGTAPTVLVTRLSGGGVNNNNINNVASGTSVSMTAVTSTALTFTVTDVSAGAVTNSLTWQNVRVRPIAATPLASGNITESGTSAIAGVTGSTNFGTLTEVSGNAVRFVIAGSGTQTAGTGQNLTITARDAASNPVTSYTGLKSLTFSGANSSSSPATAPTVKNNVGTAVQFGTATAITFTNGVATVSAGNNGVMTLYKAEAAIIAATDGTINATGADRLTVVVSAAAASKLTIPSVNGGVNPAVGSPFPITVQSQDAFGNLSNVVLATSFSLTRATGTGVLAGTSSGSIPAGSNSVSVLGLTYSKAESGVAITATRTAGDALAPGTSALFTVTAGTQTITVTTPAPANATYGATFGVAATASSGLAVAITTTGSCSGSGADSATITMTSGTGTCTVHYNQVGDANYNAASEVTNSTTANAALLDITATNDSKAYGDTTTYGPGSAAFSTGGLQLKNGDTVASVTVTDTNSGGLATAAAGGSYPLTPSAAVFGAGVASNYDIHYHAGTLTVTAALLDIAATNDSKTYGDTKTYGPGSSAFSTGVLQLKNGDTVASVTVTDTNSGGLATAAAGGSYPLTPSAAVFGTGVASNYDIHYHAGTLTVTAALLNITADTDSKSYGDLRTYGASSSAFLTGMGQLKNGDMVGTVTITDVNSGGPVTAAAGGSYPLRPSAAIFSVGIATNYDIHYVDGTLTVTAALLDITATNDSKTYGDTKTYGPGSLAFSTGVLQLKNGDTVASVTVTDTNSGGVATAAAGGSYPLTPSAAVFGAGVATNYDIHYHAGTLTVNAALLDITAAGGKSKFYGDIFTAFAGSVVGLKNTDEVDVTYASTGAPAAAAVGNYDITVASYSFTVGSAANYDIHTHTAVGGLTVNAAPLDITAAGGKSKFYGDIFTAFAGSVVGLKNTDEVDVTYASTGAPAAAAVGNYDITVASYSFTVGSAANYDIHTHTAVGGLTVNAAPLDITAAGGKSKFYGDIFTAFAGSVVGLKNTDEVDVTYASTGAPAAAAVGNYDITVASYSFTVGSAANYDIHTHTAVGGLTVNAAPLDITAAGGKSKFYGDIFTAFTGSMVGLKNTDAVDVTYASTGAPGAAAVGNYDITVASYSFTVGSAANYDIHTHTAVGGLTVNAAPLDITAAGGKSKFYGDTFTAFAGSVVGLKNTDEVDVTYGSTGAPAAAAVGNYDITVDSYSFTVGSAANYDIHTHTAVGGLTVNAAPLDITADNDSKTYGDLRSYGAGSSAFHPGVGQLKNGDMVGTVTIGDLNNGGPVTAAAGGSYPLRPSAAIFSVGVATNYDIHYVDGTLTVNAALLDITAAGGKSKFYGDIFTAFAGSVVGLKNSDAINVTYASTGAPAAAAVGSYDITVASYNFIVGSAGNYDIHTHTATNGLTVNAAPLDITAAGGKSKFYGDTFTAFTGGVVGLKNSDAVDVTYASTGAPAAAAVASYDITVASYNFTVGSAGNYDIHTHTATNGLTVNAAPLDITAAGGKSKFYGDTFTAFTGGVVGLKNSDAINVTYASTGAPAAAAVGSYDITVASYNFTVGSAGNYAIHTHTATNGMTVNRVHLTVKADNKSKAFDNTPFAAFTATITGFVNGESSAVVSGTPVFSTAPTSPAVNPGSYSIIPTLGALTAANYDFTSFVNGTLTIGYGTCSASFGPGGVILAPINSDGSSVYSRKGGSTIPVKFRVCDASGNPISNPAAVFGTSAGSITLLSAVRGTVTVVNEDAIADIPDVAFRLSGNQWIFNMASSNLDAGATYTFRINLAVGNIQFTVGVK